MQRMGRLRVPIGSSARLLRPAPQRLERSGCVSKPHTDRAWPLSLWSCGWKGGCHSSHQALTVCSCFRWSSSTRWCTKHWSTSVRRTGSTLPLKAAACPSASHVDASLIPHRHNRQTATSQQRDADGATTERDHDLVRNADAVGAAGLLLQLTMDGSWLTQLLSCLSSHSWTRTHLRRRTRSTQQQSVSAVYHLCNAVQRCLTCVSPVYHLCPPQTSQVVPLPPESLLPPESREKLKLPLIRSVWMFSGRLRF